jgi:hypothetical protein
MSSAAGPGATLAGPVAAAFGWAPDQQAGGDGWRWSWTMTLESLRSGFGLQLSVACLVVVIALAVAVAVRDRPSWQGLNPPAAALAAGSAAAILACTLTPRAHPLRPGDQVQPIPFHSVHDYLILHSPSQLLVYIGGNVVLFVPLGFFAYLAARRSFGRIVVLSAGLSFGVEFVQLFMASRSTDVDDFLTNSLGGFLGVLAGWVAVRLARVVRARRYVEAPQT